MDQLWRLTGGRPMARVLFAFVDVVSGKDVYSYIDRLGRCWLATSAWASFRVPIPIDVEEIERMHRVLNG